MKTTISGKTKIVGVWGHPVAHSLSPAMHNAAFAKLGLDWAYVPFDVSPDRVAEAVAGLRALGLVGVNVTIPLKEAVIPYLDFIDDTARKVGAVNTIHAVNGALYGYSTDGYGFLQSLQDIGEQNENRKVCLLGAGGSAKAVAFALAQHGGKIVIVNRTQSRAQELAEMVNDNYPEAAAVAGREDRLEEFDLIVNTTSLGMIPNVDELPVLPPGELHSGQCVYDLIYAPAETRLLRLARKQGCRICNGVKMLVYQGALSFSIWTGTRREDVPVIVMEEALRENLQR